MLFRPPPPPLSFLPLVIFAGSDLPEIASPECDGVCKYLHKMLGSEGTLDLLGKIDTRDDSLHKYFVKGTFSFLILWVRFAYSRERERERERERKGGGEGGGGARVRKNGAAYF